MATHHPGTNPASVAISGPERDMPAAGPSPAGAPSLGNEAGTLATAERHRHYLEAATAENTRRTYRSAIRHFERAGGLLPATEAGILRYLLDHAATLSPQTLSLRLTALRQWHHYQGFPDPTATPEVRKALAGITRLHGRPARKAKALRIEQVEALVTTLVAQGNSLRAVRDRALLLVGFFGAFRRSELVGVRVADLSFGPEGLLVRIPRSKTDQTGQGKLKALPAAGGPLCPVAALRQWLALAGIAEGPVFRSVDRWGALGGEPLSPASVNLILKGAAQAGGLMAYRN